MGVNKRVYTNHELARRYAEKQMIVGERLRFKLLDNDRVTLTDVLDKSNTGRIEIPSFITDITIELGILG